MKLKIEKRKDSMKAYVLRLMDGEAVAEIWDDAGSYDPALLARLFQSAEELLEYMESNVGEGDMSNHHQGNDKSKKKLISYIKTGDKDDMVTLRMSRTTAESEKLERFIIKE